MAYTSINKSTDYFEAKTYDGTGASRTLAYDFEVDFFWCKMRNDVYPHNLSDVVRGNLGILRANGNNAEVGAANTVSFGNTSGITLGSDSSSYGVNQALNDSSVQATYVGYGWKADNTSGSSNTDGSITSTVSANTTSGFSIVSYTGNSTAGATFGHGLGVSPKMIIIKDRTNGTKNWTCYHNSMGNDRSIFLNLTNAQTASTDHWHYTTPTSSLVYIGNYSHINSSSNNYVAYCFAEKKGFSKFGSYVGSNGGADGPYIHLGFKPAFILIKNTSAVADWHIRDNKRDTYNASTHFLLPNSSNAEVTAGEAIDILSNGFKIKANGLKVQDSGNTYIYMAFAESPFTTSTGIPTTAR